MNREIQKYINSIGTYDSLTKDGDIKTIFTFYGDGDGDFEENFNSSSDQIVKEYIKYCKEQIRLAKLYLKTK